MSPAPARAGRALAAARRFAAGTVGRLADDAFALRPAKRRRPMTFRDHMGLGRGVIRDGARAAGSTAALGVLFLLTLGLLYVVGRVGVRLLEVVAWVSAAGVLFHFRDRIKLGRVLDKLREAAPADPAPARRGEGDVP